MSVKSEDQREKWRAASSRYRAAHREEILAKRREYAATHPEKQSAANAKYKATHRAEWAAYCAAYHAAHRDEIAARVKAYRAEHREQYQLGKAAYRAAHPDADRAYAAAHPEQTAIHNARRRAKIVNAPGSGVSLAEWRAIQAAYNHRCVYCGRADVRLTQDHLIPLSQGGAHDPTNVAPACRNCNSRKSTGAPPIPVALKMAI